MIFLPCEQDNGAGSQSVRQQAVQSPECRRIEMRSTNTQHHRPPEAWRSLETSGPGQGTPERDARSLALAKAVVEKIEADPALVAVAQRNLERWRKQGAGELSRASDEWAELLANLEWIGIKAILIDPSKEGKRLRKSHPFTGILTEAVRRAIHDAHPA